MPVFSRCAHDQTFPGVVAVDNVDIDIAAGEIVALLGQNGAGKSTLIQVLSGLYPFGSYTGEVTLGGSAFAMSTRWPRRKRPLRRRVPSARGQRRGGPDG